MKILVITPTFLPVIGGVETAIYEIFRRIALRHEVHILTPNLPDKVLQQYGVDDNYYAETNFQVHHFNQNHLDFHLFAGRNILGGIIPPFSLSGVRPIFDYVTELKPDVINFHYALPYGLAIMKIHQETEIPILLSLVSRIDVLTSDTPFFTKIYLKQVIKACSKVTCLVNYYVSGFPSINNLTVVPYGADADRFKPGVQSDKLRASLNIQDNQKILFTLQRLAKVKRVDILLKSMPYILEVKKEVVLVIGGKGTEKPYLQKLAQQLKIEENIRFIDYIPDHELPQYFSMADIFTFHSTNETFGVVLVQAMAAGKPIVSVNATAIPEVVQHNINGLLVEPNNPKEFAKAVIELLDNDNIRQQFAQNNRQIAVEKYDWNVISQQYEKMLCELV